MTKEKSENKAEYIKVVRCADCVFLHRNFETSTQLSCGNLNGMIKPTLNGGCSYGERKDAQ